MTPSNTPSRATGLHSWLVGGLAVAVALPMVWFWHRGYDAETHGTAQPSNGTARCRSGAPCDAPGEAEEDAILDDRSVPERGVASDVPPAVTASNQPNPSGVALKSTTPGLVAGRLPIPGRVALDTRSPRAEVTQDIAARESRAAMLNRRLETQLATMRAGVERARAAGDREQQQSLERDIAILESQLTTRRALESPKRVPHRP